MRARSGDVELALQSLRVGLVPEIVLASRASAPHEIRRGYLTVATRAPCSGGAAISRISVDDAAEAWLLPAGEHTLRLESEDRLKGYTLDVVADIEMADGTCVRAPVLSQSIPLRPAPRVVLVAGGGAEGNTDLAGVKAAADFHVGVGGTYGPVLLTAQLGLGTAQCIAAVCGPGDGGKARIGTAFSGSLTATRGVPLGGGALRGMMLTAGARYAFMTTRLPALESSRRLDFHSLQALVGWGMGVGFAGPFQRRDLTPLMELAVPVGVMAEQSALSRVAFVAGVEARFLIDL